MMSVRINNKKWFDLGSDVNWQDYGGCWGKPMPTETEPDRWAVIRLDTESDDGLAYAVAVHVRVSEVTDDDLKTCDVPLDGLDEYGDPIPTQVYEAEKVRAYIQTWGSSGRAGGETFRNRRADTARLDAVHFLEDV